MPDRRKDQPDFDRLSDLMPAAGAPSSGAPRAGAPAAKPGGGSASGLGRSAGPGPDAAAEADALSQRLAAVWAEVVGAEVAQNARPVQLRDGRLVVTTSSSAWAQTLQMMSPMIVAGLQERLGEGSVQKAVFRHAGWDVFAPLDPRAKATGGAGAAAARKSRQARREQQPGLHSAPVASEATAAVPLPAAGAAAQAGDVLSDVAVEGVAGTSSIPPSTAPSGAAPGGGLDGLSPEEQQALADLDALPLAPSVKRTIREAMKAGFARARQDSGRS
jgi:hypothetical protein